MTNCYTIVRNGITDEVHLIPVTNLLDANGNEILDLDLAVSFVAPLPDGQWLAASVADFDVYRLH